MNDALLLSLENLRDCIESDPRVLRLNELDKKLNEDEEVMKLAYQKDMALLSYEDALKHFKEDSKEVRDAQKRLHEAKLQLDLNSLVKQYNEAYKEVRLMYEKINKILFDPFMDKSRCNND